MTNFREYQRTQRAQMRPVTAKEIAMGRRIQNEGISISDEDKRNGSPKEGDMIARNPENHADQWLVAEAYFEKNFEEIEGAEDIDDNPDDNPDAETTQLPDDQENNAAPSGAKEE